MKKIAATVLLAAFCVFWTVAHAETLAPKTWVNERIKDATNDFEKTTLKAATNDFAKTTLKTATNELDKAVSAKLAAHTGNSDVHVTSAQKSSWTGHVSNSGIHVTSSQKSAWDNHMSDSDSHVSYEDKEYWNSKLDSGYGQYSLYFNEYGLNISDGNEHSYMTPYGIYSYSYNPYYGYWDYWSAHDIANNAFDMANSAYYWADEAYSYASWAESDAMYAQEMIGHHTEDLDNPHQVTMWQVGVSADNPDFVDLIDQVSPIDPTNEKFSNAVHAVGFNIPIDVLREINQIVARGSFYSNVHYVVDDYFQNNPIRKAVKMERTGLSGDLGTGWGYMLYDWRSDIRDWRLKLPKFDALSVSANPATAEQRKVFTVKDTSGSDHEVAYNFYPCHPLLVEVCDFPQASQLDVTLKRTDGKYGDDACASATYVIPFLTAKETGGVFMGVDPTVTMSATGSVCAAYMPGGTNQDITVYREFEENYPPFGLIHFNMSFRMRNFRIVTVQVEGITTVTLTYDCESHVVITGETILDGRFETTETTSPIVSLAVSRNDMSLHTMEVPGHRMATVSASHYFYDAGMDETFRIEVTNRCFYARKIADGDVTNKMESDLQ